VRVIVAGAGIGGLSAALSPHAAGIGAVVIDPAASLRPLGMGINLMPHAVRELTELAAFDDAYRATTLPDVAALNSRPSLTPTSGAS